MNKALYGCLFVSTIIIGFFLPYRIANINSTSEWWGVVLRSIVLIANIRMLYTYPHDKLKHDL